MKFIDQLLDDKSDSELQFFWQLVGPLFVLCTFALDPTNFFIFFVGVLGLFLCSRWQMTGLLYSLVLLVLAAVSEHFFLEGRHLWMLGIEGSYAVAFYITALNAERHSHFLESLFSQLQAKDSSISNLEEEYTKSKEHSTSQQIFLQEKGGAIQTRYDELSSEYSSILILNEVLRKTAARESADKELLQGDLLDLQSRLSASIKEESDLKKELSRLKNSNALVLENSQLIDEINRVRLEKEQTHRINEMLARLHAKESMRAQEAFELLSRLEKEKEASSPAAPDLSQYVPRQEVDALETQLKELHTLGSLHKQLKAQFEEKNATLHKTRSELFHVENTLQALQIEKEGNALTYNPIPDEMIDEISALEEIVAGLREENEELQNLVSYLTLQETLLKRKKKVKMIPEQDLLF